ncbi:MULTISPECIES: adenine nucleotide alpha hydrolase family protein [Prauserella]|uniref:hypothetical protein n=1 Tax=Prauserella TaxID=142577 RepID=UPI00197CDC53|nr:MULTISPECIES: hypothetical protein [Prauserella]
MGHHDCHEKTDDPDLARYDIILVNSSGGKDSQAMLDVVCRRAADAGVLDRITVLHCALGRVEWPGTADLARRQALHYGVRYEERHPEQGDLLTQARQRGRWPSATARYCASDQKRGPARKLVTQLVNELGTINRPAQVLNCMGLRAQESRARLKKFQQCCAGCITGPAGFACEVARGRFARRPSSITCPPC